MTIHPLNTLPNTLDIAPAGPSAAKGRSVPVEKVAAVPEDASKTQQRQVPQVDTSQMAEELNRLIEKTGVELSFSVDQDLDMVIVTMSKSGSDEVIRQIPSKEMVELARRVQEMLARGDSKGAFLGLMS